MTEAGTWAYLQSSTDTLSCIFLQSSTIIIAINYDAVMNTLTKVFNLTLTSDLDLSTLQVGEGCKLISFGTKVYTLSLTSMTLINTFSSAIQASSTDLTYVISGGLLHRLQSGTYRQIQTLTTFNKYKIRSSQDQLVIYGWSSTTSANITTVNMRLYVCMYQTSLSIINNFNVTSSNSPLNYIPVMISPSLTKIHYVSYAGSAITHVFKQVDFSGKTVTDIEQKSADRFLSTTANMNQFSQSNYFLGDSHLVIRNDSSSAGSSNYF